MEEYSTKGANGIESFAASTSSGAIELGNISVAVFTQALENIATLRAENGGSVSRLQFSKEEVAAQRTNLEAANGRIMDVDIASESTRLAKFNILVQASASMLSQANASPNVALMLQLNSTRVLLPANLSATQATGGCLKIRKSRRIKKMPLNINTNSAAASASYYLSKNNAALQRFHPLINGSRITQPADDAGGLAVSMKLSGTI